MDLLLMMAATDAGLGTLQANLVSNWIGPILFIVVAGISIKFIISRQFRELAGFLGIAAVVGLLVFNAGGLFGANGVFSGIAEGFSSKFKDGGASAEAQKSGTINYISNIQNMGSYEIEFPDSK